MVGGKDETRVQTVKMREIDKKLDREFAFFSPGAWQPLLLCSFELFVVGVITCGPGQKVSPLCLMWKTATAPPTAGRERLCFSMVLGIREQIKERTGPKVFIWDRTSMSARPISIEMYSNSPACLVWLRSYSG